MGEVVSLAEVREARARPATGLPQTAGDLLSAYRRILAVAPQRVTSGAVGLLMVVAGRNHEGVTDLSYRFLAQACGLSLSSVVRHIDTLEELRMLRVRRARTGKQCAVNQIEIDFSGPLGGTMPILKLPKNTKNLGVVKKTTDYDLQRIGVLSKPERYIIDKSISSSNTIPKGIGRSAPRFDTAEEAIAAATQRVTRKREDKAATAAKTAARLTLAGVKATWASAMLRHYPSVPSVTFSAREFAILKMKIQPIVATANLSEFFDYIVSSWASLRETRFIWLRVKGKDIAVAPSLPELMRYWKVFAQAFSDHRMSDTDNARKTARSATQDARDALAEVNAAKAKTDAENALLRQRLAKAERMAYAPRKDVKEEPSLSARRKAADESYNGGFDIPEWK